MTQEQQYLITQEMSVTQLKSKLADRVRLDDGGTARLKRVYLDSFDWRLYSAGYWLLEESKAGQKQLYYYSHSPLQQIFKAAISDSVRFAWDLIPGPLQHHLATRLKMRALVSQATLETQCHALHVLNNDDKTVVRLYFEVSHLCVRNHRKQRLKKRLRVMAVKGYHKDYQALIKRCEKHLRLTPAQAPQLLEALSLVGRRVNDYSAKLAVTLEPQMRCDAAMRLIFLRLLEIMEANEPGLCAGLDSEFLHDFRVAVRRSRTALSQMKKVLPARTLSRFRRDFAWLGEITGPTRDMDVYLLNFDDYRNSLPDGQAIHLEPLRTFLIAHQQSAHRSLVQKTNSARYRRFKQAWRRYLESPLAKRSRLDNATRPIASVANKRIWRLYRRVIHEGDAITDQCPAEALHELRKTCKKLRYLLEFFRSLYPPAKIKQLLKILKALQENLGAFQDYHVQHIALADIKRQMLQEGEIPRATLKAMDMLIVLLIDGQQQQREAFANRFEHFATDKHHELFAALFSQ